MTLPSLPSLPGRRSATAAGRRLDVTIVLAVLLPLVSVLLVLLARPPTFAPQSLAPALDDLSRATLLCPGGGAETVLGTAGGAAGDATARVSNKDRTVRLAPESVTRIEGRAPVVVTGVDDLAPALVGSVLGDGAGTTCRPPSSDQWFTGVGAGARHLSTLELVNPDAGPALVDVLVYGRDGLVDVPELRGLAVPGSGRATVDLARTVPRRDDLTLRVTTARGRVGASVLDSYDQLGAGASSSDWLPPQATPLTENELVGLPSGAGQRTLVLTNPGDDETRATVQVVSRTSVFTPEGVEDVVLPPQSVTRVSASRLVGRDALRDAIGLRVTTAEPVTASLRSFLDGALTHTVPGDRLVEPTTLLVPEGGGRLLLTGSSGVGAVKVTARAADGKVVTRKTLDVVADRAYAVPLPNRTALVEVVPQSTTLTGAVLTTGDVVTLLPLVELLRSGLVAQVRPGLD